jgi:hypothetical protein
MLVYSPIITHRLRYTCNFIAREIFQHQPEVMPELTSDTVVYANYPGYRINYSTEEQPGTGLHIQPQGLLGEQGIRLQNIQCFQAGDYPAFFKTTGEPGFDMFAAIFFLLSRYEEYLPHQQDMYGRYAHQQSLAFRENFLDRPVINYWLKHLRDLLAGQHPEKSVSAPAFKFEPTYDIDEAYAYRYKDWKRSAGAAIKNLLKGDWKSWAERRNVLAGKIADPFDAYSWIDDLHRPYAFRPHYFFLVPAKTGKYDRNILPAETAMQSLIQQHAKKYAIGIHPSWQSGDDTTLLQTEIHRLEQISGVKITASRQHFIRMRLPDTYRRLLHAGIKEDFSMGYGSINGFRASVASPFYWYDLENEQATSLLLRPFCYMEANSFYEQKITPLQALEEMRHYYTITKKVNGTLSMIWHNTFLGTAKKFSGWREVYRQFIEEIAHH